MLIRIYSENQALYLSFNGNKGFLNVVIEGFMKQIVKETQT